MKTNFENRAKKIFLSLMLVCISFWGWTATYYVSSTGNDSNTGLTTTLAWQNLSKVNAMTFVAGDQILFRRGDTFYGSINIKNAGNAGSPITVGAYGTGANPIITGFTNVTSWTNLGGNIWESTNAVSTLSTCEMVSINGVNTAKGRYPNYTNSNSDFLWFQSHSGKTSITSSGLTGTPNWTGGEAVVRTSVWTYERPKIASQNGGTLTWVAATSYTPGDNFGFFIQDDPRTLDVQNEWYYNPTTKKIRIYSTSQPVNVKVATVDYLITNNPANITIENLTFTGANHTAIYSTNRGNNKIVRNCNVSFCGVAGIQIVGYYSNVSDCIVDNCNNFGITQVDNNKNCKISRCTVRNIGTIIGMGTNGGYSGITSGGLYNHALVIENCSIINCGFNGTNLTGDSIIVKNNYVDNFCNVLSDGGGIYIGRSARPYPNEITDNIVVNGGLTGSANYGTPAAEDPSVYPKHYPVQAMGIYVDLLADNYKLLRNTIAFCSIGILTAALSDVDIQYNTVYNTMYQSIALAGGINNGNTNNSIKHNIFVQKGITRIAYYITNSTIDDTPTLADFDYNVYARPIDDYGSIQWLDQFPFYTKAEGITPTIKNYRSFEQWKSFSGKEVHSTKSPQAITSVNDLRFEYNATTTAKTVALSVPMIDMKGIKYASSVILQPFTSVVLIKDNKPAKYFSEYKSICEGTSYYTWTTTGKYERTLVTKSGVDSIVTTYLTVNLKYAVTETVTILDGENYNLWTKAGQYVRNLNSVSGCDSVVTTNLIVDITSIKVGETMTQTIALKKGNNMISTYLQATNSDISAITQTIRDSGNLIKMQNESGNSYENWGILGGWINNLGSIQNTEGYKIMVANNCTIQITGQQIALPLDIPLNAGWNIISFPRTDILDAQLIVQALIDQNKLVKVQDETGNSIEDWGSFGGWKNAIGNFLPGKAYRVKVSANTVLTIRDSYPKSVVSPVYAEQTQHFFSVAEGNGSDHMNINLVDLDESGLSVGDELAAFDGDLCVGALHITNQHLLEGSASLLASCASGNTRNDGFNEGSSIRLQVWNHITGEQSAIQISILNGSANYLKNESILGKLKSLTTAAPILEDKSQIEVFPNPSQGQFTVRFSDVPVLGSRIDVYDVSGRKITSQLITGITEEIDITGQAAGMYLVKSNIGVKETINKLVIQ
jgi:hypothetical protein